MLEWDTRFFGFPVADLRVQDGESADLTRAMDEAGAIGATLLVYRVPHGMSIDCPDSGVLADTQHTYEMPFERYVPDWLLGDAKPERYEGDCMEPVLAHLSELAGAQSRFFHDRKFPRAAAQALYHKWIHNIVSREFSNRILVLVERDENGAICAMGASYIDANGHGVPSLMATLPGQGTRGFGRAYFNQMMIWFQDEGVRMARIKTQERCKMACNLYKRAGWDLTSREDIYHIWLDEPKTKESYF